MVLKNLWQLLVLVRYGKLSIPSRKVDPTNSRESDGSLNGPERFMIKGHGNGL